MSIDTNCEEGVISSLSVYGFRQNNSGGYFTEPAQSIIVIDAKDEDHALEIAKKAGLYLEGIKNGIDCYCCGDRWNDFVYEFEALSDAKSWAEKGHYGDSGVPAYCYASSDD